ncbi:hypothetical protein NTGZN8_130147 [Candidatus Nitrotoga fabula]|uniref:Uncharacterized protein n=1 Tax=Candidatus Nitrotoga fabula TaxID=2182327 RepID=A0A916F8Z6_9PROT|nr:hypothetical protein NTGZN8_130147 [Candidatus Nitrotoga fabula]
MMYPERRTKPLNPDQLLWRHDQHLYPSLFYKKLYSHVKMKNYAFILPSALFKTSPYFNY